MRKLIPALVLVALGALLPATAAHADVAAKPAPTTCLTMPQLNFNIELPSLPSICDLKARIGELAVHLGVSLNVALAKLLAFVAQVKVGLDAALNVLLSLPAWVARLLCL